MPRKFIPLAWLILAMLLQTSPTPIRAFFVGPAGFIPASLSAGALSVKPASPADFNHDGSPESLVISNGRFTIYSSGTAVWQSPEVWQVIQAMATDLNHDGSPEATLLIWRPFRPWPVDQWLPHGGRIDNFQDAEGKSCHIILIGWRGGEYGELWAGSALAEPVRSFDVADFNGDNLQEMVTLEGSYQDSRTAPGRALKVWEWNGFGFTNLSAIEGTFEKMALVQTNTGHILILIP